MTGFADLADGGRKLVEPLRDVVATLTDPMVLAIVPNGVPAAVVIGAALGLPVEAAALMRDGEPRVVEMPDVLGRAVIVVDDGVETGTAARLVGLAARDAGAASLLLAVPVCPRESAAALDRVFGTIVAIDRPLVRRDLRWHYADFDTIDEAEARRRLAAR